MKLADDEKLVVSFWGSLGALYMNRHMAGFIELESQHDSFPAYSCDGHRCVQVAPDSIKEKGVDLDKHRTLTARVYL